MDCVDTFLEVNLEMQHELIYLGPDIKLKEKFHLLYFDQIG